MASVTLQGSISSFAPTPRGGFSARPKSSDAAFEVSIQTDTSGVKGDKSKAENASVAAAAGSALDDVTTLSSLAGAIGSNPDHKGISTFTFDRGGNVLAGAALDGGGDLEVYGSGSARGASSEIGLYVPGAQGQSWASQASSGLAQAAYTLNSILDEVSKQTTGGVVYASA